MTLDQSVTITELAERAYRTAVDKGWWDEPRTFGDQIALMHSELSEALEDFRNKRDPAEIYFEGEKPCGIPIEFADLLIRVGDTCRRHGIDIESACVMKLLYNQTRPHRHGGKVL